MDLLSFRKRSLRGGMKTILVLRKFLMEWNEQCFPLPEGEHWTRATRLGKTVLLMCGRLPKEMQHLLV